MAQLARCETTSPLRPADNTNKQIAVKKKAITTANKRRYDILASPGSGFEHFAMKYGTQDAVTYPYVARRFPSTQPNILHRVNNNNKKHVTTTTRSPPLYLGSVEHHGRETRGHLRVEPDLDPRLDLVLALHQQIQHLLLTKKNNNKKQAPHNRTVLLRQHTQIVMGTTKALQIVWTEVNDTPRQTNVQYTGQPPR